MGAVPHPHCLGDISVALVITVMYVNKWQDHILPARLLQDHNVLSTLQTFLKNPGRRATVTREELLGSTTDRSSLDCKDKMDKHANFVSRTARRSKQRGSHADAAPSRRRPTVAHRRRQRSTSNRSAEYEKRVQLHTALQSAVYCKQTLTGPKIQANLGRRRSAASASNMEAKTFSTY